MNIQRQCSGTLGETRRGILLVAPFDEHLISLLRILGHTRWDILWHTNLEDALASFTEEHVDVVICDRELPDGDWKHVVRRVRTLNNAPAAIVTSLAWDDRLWADVRNQGGYDVLMKPYDGEEVLRTIALAERFRMPARSAADRTGVPAA